MLLTWLLPCGSSVSFIADGPVSNKSDVSFDRSTPLTYEPTSCWHGYLHVGPALFFGDNVFLDRLTILTRGPIVDHMLTTTSITITVCRHVQFISFCKTGEHICAKFEFQCKFSPRTRDYIGNITTVSQTVWDFNTESENKIRHLDMVSSPSNNALLWWRCFLAMGNELLW